MPIIPTVQLNPESNPELKQMQALNQERFQKIDRPEVQKPSDAALFTQINESAAIPDTQITLSINNPSPVLPISYSQTGIQALAKATELETPPSPTMKIHLYTSEIGTAAETSFDKGYCQTVAPFAYVSILKRYVLPLYGLNENDWRAQETELMAEWNNRMQAVLYHEARHASKHFDIQDCMVNSTEPQTQAEIDAMQFEITTAQKNPPAIWIEKGPTRKSIFNIPLVRTIVSDPI